MIGGDDVPRAERHGNADAADDPGVTRISTRTD